MSQAEENPPAGTDVDAFLRERRNWGRWGDDDQRGAINLITAGKRARSAVLVRTGRTVSLSRDFPKRPGPSNPEPAQHFMRFNHRPDGSGASADFYGVFYHGYASTHIDALCHVWGPDGMWGGRDARNELNTSGTRWGGIHHWRDGILTRGVLLDVPAHRGASYVTADAPVEGAELEEIAKRQGLLMEPGDALVVYGGRDAFETAHPEWSFLDAVERPGLASSCLLFLRGHDVALIAWDFMDATPVGDARPTIHQGIAAFGLALVDNCHLGELARACREEGRYEFMLFIAPLAVVGGTGSPVNPIAVF
jgi:kynurenine formamidase